MIQHGDTSKVTSDQLKALQKLLPDSDTVRALTGAPACYMHFSPIQTEMLKAYDGDLTLLGKAEDFYLKLTALKQ